MSNGKNAPLNLSPFVAAQKSNEYGEESIEIRLVSLFF
jgi:hypothetical protein